MQAYLVFSSGQIGELQRTLQPTCFASFENCDQTFVKHVSNYIVIIGIMVRERRKGMTTDTRWMA